MKILVQKFGGTCLSTQEGREKTAAHVKKAKENGYDVVAVFSAMGRFPDPYATDSLIRLIRDEAEAQVKDLLMPCGELIACAVMADLLNSINVPCEILALEEIGIITNEQHGSAEILEIDPLPVLSVLQSSSVAVVPGFQGVTRKRKVTTLGRGGSDITAAALGAALKAECVEIYKDVEGLRTADPSLVPDAHIVSEISFQEIGEMAYRGAKVLHPKAVSFALEKNLPIRIRSVFSEKSETVVASETVKFNKTVSGIAHIPNMAFVQVKMNSDLEEARHKLFKTFAEKRISLDLITVSSQGVCFIVEENRSSEVERILSKLEWEFTIESGFSKITIVGAGMRGMPGVMLRVVDALRNAGIRLYHSTDSHITIACLVKQSEMEKAVRVLHSAFLDSGRNS